MKIIRAHGMRVPLVVGMTVALSAGAPATPPSITPTVALHSQAVFVGKAASLSVVASGTKPLFYQWRLGGRDVSGQTNSTLTIAAAQPADEADYSVVVSNSDGTASSEPFRLFVLPPATNFMKGNFTNTLGARLPYFYHLPANYNPDRRYPLVFNVHGSGWDERVLPNGFWDWPEVLVFASYQQQAKDPAIVVWPTHTAQAGSSSWSSNEVRLIADLLDRLITELNVDTNRVYLTGASAGGGPAMDVAGLRPDLAAAIVVWSGSAGSIPASTIKHVPLWGFQADDEGNGAVDFIGRLRAAGGSPISTRYGKGGHDAAIHTGMACPAMVDWLLAQRRGQTTPPSLSITGPTSEPVRKTGASSIDLVGSAEGFGPEVARVSWENTTSRIRRSASGTSLWTANALPLVSDKTNVIVVIATMNTAWAPAYGGITTFNDTMTVICSPVRVTVTLQGTDAILNWSGGVLPYRVQRATDLASGDWKEVLTNAVPPIALTLERRAEFYRIVGE